MSLKTLTEIFDLDKRRGQGSSSLKPAVPLKDRPADYDKLRRTMEKEQEKRKAANLKEKATKKIKKKVADRIKLLMKP